MGMGFLRLEKGPSNQGFKTYWLPNWNRFDWRRRLVGWETFGGLLPGWRIIP